MILLGFSEFINNWKRNIPVILMSSIISVILVLIYSLLSYERNRISPFENMVSERGFVIFGSDVEELVPNAKKVLCSLSRCDLTLDDGMEIPLYAMNEWVRSWKPRIYEGKFSDELENDGTIPVIIGGVDRGEYKVGDIINASTYEGRRLMLKVTGIVIKGSSVLAPCNTYKVDEFDYRMVYSPSTEIFVMCAEEFMPKNIKYIFQDGIKVAMMGDDISEEEYIETYHRIRNKTGGCCIEISEFVENSYKIYNEKLITYMPLAVMGIVVMVICCSAAIYVNYKYEIKHYTIYHLMGCKKHQRFLIALVGSIFISVSSIVFTLIIIMYGRTFYIFEKYMIFLDGGAYAVLAVYYIVFATLIAVITMLSMRSMSPKEQLIKIRR